MGVPFQVRPPVDQHTYRRRTRPPRLLRRAQGAEAKVRLDDDEVGPLAQSVRGRVGESLEDRRIAGGDAGLAEHLTLLLANLDQRYVKSGFLYNLSRPLITQLG
jgi:hypothetical protein